MEILQQESQLQEIVKLVGPDTLPDAQRFVLLVARMIKEAFLQQNAMDPVDAYYDRRPSRWRCCSLLVHLYRAGQHGHRQGRAGRTPPERGHGVAAADPRQEPTSPTTTWPTSGRCSDEIDEQLDQHREGLYRHERRHDRPASDDAAPRLQHQSSTQGLSEIYGPIIVVEGVGDVGYDEAVEITLPDGALRRGRVLEAARERP